MLKTNKVAIKMTKNDKNTNLDNSCRICGNRASYSVFQMIPAYLHETDHEYMNWKKPISHYLTFILNQPINQNDGLPQKMCVLCISYMKHAYNFKIQAIRNMGIHAMKDTQQQLMLNKSLAETEPNCDKDQSIDRLLKQSIIEETSDENLEVCDEPDDGDKTLTEIFTYAHTNFEEDDITQLEIFQTNQIGLYLPETFKERKCISCKRRFMFEDSYNEHIKDCIQLKLVSFIREVYQLLYLKESRSISSHEFIRRVIFSIKKTVQILVEYDESVKNQVESAANDTLRASNKPKPKTDAKAAQMTPEAFISKIKIKDVFSNSLSESEGITNTSNTSSPIVCLSIKCPNCNINFENVSDLESHNFQYHNTVLQSPSLLSKPQTRKTKLTQYQYQRFKQDTEESSNTEMNNLYLTKDTRAHYFRNLNSVHSKGQFDKKIDIIKNNLCDDGDNASDPDGSDARKLVKCSKCNEKFLTISHLDLHVTKKHSRSPALSQSMSSQSELNKNPFVCSSSRTIPELHSKSFRQ